LPVKSGLIFASRNVYAVDIIASEMIGFHPEDIFTNKYSHIKTSSIKRLAMEEKI